MANTVGNEITVFITQSEATCGDCGEQLGRHAWITLDKDKRAMCLACADLEHLVFLPTGDAALTRRARKHAVLSAVVLRWSRARKRYERQGLLVEEAALAQAEQECLADADARERRRAREAERRAEQDQEHIQRFASAIRKRYPALPQGREHVIAEHACLKYSGRVGRSTGAKQSDPQSIDLAVRAHVRHAETNYDELLAQGWDRNQARDEVESQARGILAQWGSECH